MLYFIEKETGSGSSSMTPNTKSFLDAIGFDTFPTEIQKGLKEILGIESELAKKFPIGSKVKILLNRRELEDMLYERCDYDEEDSQDLADALFGDPDPIITAITPLDCGEGLKTYIVVGQMPCWDVIPFEEDEIELV